MTSSHPKVLQELIRDQLRKLPTPVVHHIALELSPDLIRNRHQSIKTLQECIFHLTVKSTTQETS